MSSNSPPCSAPASSRGRSGNLVEEGISTPGRLLLTLAACGERQGPAAFPACSLTFVGACCAFGLLAKTSPLDAIVEA
jgi:hypothetical protein